MGKPKYSFNNINTEDCPCKGCTPPKRNATCHANCQEYIDWDDKHKEKLAQRQHQKDMDEIYYSGAFRRNRSLMQKGAKFGRGKK